MEQKGKGKANFIFLFLHSFGPSIFSSPQALENLVWPLVSGTYTSSPLFLKHLGSNWELHHWFPWFSGLWNWTKLYQYLSLFSSLQTANCGIFFVSITMRINSNNKYLLISIYLPFYHHLLIIFHLLLVLFL